MTRLKQAFWGGASSLRIRRYALLCAGALALSACMFLDVKKQQAKLDEFCAIEGRVSAERREQKPIVVVLVRKIGADLNRRESWEIADHFVLGGPGRWAFRASADTYGLVAFQDMNADLKVQQNEPYLRLEAGKLIECKSGGAHKDIALVIPAAGRPRFSGEADIAALQARPVHEQMQVSLGQLTALGEVTSLDNPRFADKIGEDSLWRPFDFIIEGYAGVYFLEPYDAAKTPVLFVHGITGNPTNFRTLIGRLDRRRFQPWGYYYPSGAHLAAVADHLTQTMHKLQLQHGFRSFVVVAHSMGGLVSRGFILRYETPASRATIPLYVTIATPWGGHKAAQLGVDTAPVVVRVWEDMAPASAYLRDLFYSDPATSKQHRGLPRGTPHHLMFTYKQTGVSMGEAADGTVTVSSQLDWSAQLDAARLYGFNETHMSVLESAATSTLLNELLAKSGG
jgi:pimeloyl-ACP methyl ester carboxylesterase